MSYFQEKYKCKRVGFSNVAAGRRIRASEKIERSKNDRDDIINQRRNISPIITNAQSKGTQMAPVKESRLIRFQKWKAERDKRRKEEKYKKRKPFVVGIVHHNLYYPISQEKPVTSKNICPIVPKRITRATEKRLMSKTVVQKNNVKNKVKNPTSKNTDINKEQKNKEKKKESFAPEGYTFKPPAGLPCIPLFGRVVIESMSPAMLNMSAVGKNSSIKKSRKNMDTRESIMKTRKSTLNAVRSKLSFNGDKAFDCRNEDNKNEKIKDNTTKAVRSRDSSRRKSNRLSIDDTIDLNTSYTVVEEEKCTADNYQILLNNEVVKLNEMCQKWKEIKGTSGITRDERYKINETICQTNFVINHKLERFREFIANCKSGGMFVKREDLQELWDMACVDVKDCVRRFQKLEEIHSRLCQEQETLANRSSIGKKVQMKKKSLQ